MSALGLICGKVWRATEGRTSKNRKTFATAIMREGAGDSITWSVVAFADNASELLLLNDGDHASISGPFTVATYVKDGSTRLRHKIVADRIAAPRLSGRRSAA
jgi:hypothetical protein